MHLRTSRQDWWVQKLRRNVERDDEVTKALEAMGWTVLRIWESDIQKELAITLERVSYALALPQRRI